MIQEPLQQEILSRIDKLAEKLGVTVEYLWPQLVRLTVIEAVTVILTAVVAIVVAIVLWVKFTKVDSYDNEGWLVGATVMSLIAAGLIISTLCFGIPALLMPEAVTVRGLLP